MLDDDSWSLTRCFNLPRLFGKKRVYLYLNELMESPCQHLLFSVRFLFGLPLLRRTSNLWVNGKQPSHPLEKLKSWVARVVFLPEEQPLSFIAPVREPWTCPQVGQKLWQPKSLRTLVIFGEVKSKNNVGEVILARHILNNFEGILMHSSPHNHGSGEWVPTRRSFSLRSFSTSMVMGERVY